MTPTTRLLRPDLTDAALDRLVAAAVFGYAVTEGPDGAAAAHIGEGHHSRLVDLPRVSTDLAAAWQAATVAMEDGQADGFATTTLAPPDGQRQFSATFLREHGEETVPLAAASAESMPRAICAAILILYEGADRARLYPPTRSLQ